MASKKKRAPPARKTKQAREQLAGKPSGGGHDGAGRDAREKARGSRARKRQFPVVGLGASAGGLAALEEFFENVPQNAGMAFVVVTHQAPGRTTLLPELLARRARIAVTTAAHGVKLEPSHAYVAPPGGGVLVRDDRFEIEVETSPRLPIDHFFRSLAESEGDDAIGVLLSGNGSDGSIGVTAIKGAAGLVIAQDPKSAQYPSMPSSAIATQLVDHVLRPSEMPECLQRYVGARKLAPVQPFDHSDEDVRLGLQRILVFLRKRTGSDFTAYKKSTIGRRIERRMGVHGLSSLAEYANFIEQTPFEVDALFKELLISVTSFFRDPPAFEVLEHELVRLVEGKPEDGSLRVWVPGCATGEEAYSIAILIKQVMQRCKRDLKVQIFATDLDAHAVETARGGRYSEGIAADVSPERLEHYFSRDDSGYRVNKDVRELLIFAVQNVVKDPPFTKLDLLSCRNLLIYLEPELQRRLLVLFSYALRPAGVLMLGTSESVSGFDDRFAVLDKRWKLFQRRQSGSAMLLPDFSADLPVTTIPREAGRAAREVSHLSSSIGVLAERTMLACFAPPSVMMSERGELIYLHGHTGPFLEPTPGEPSNNVFNMAREGLRLELPAAVRVAAASDTPVVRRGVQVKTNGGYSVVTLVARRLTEPEPLRGAFLVSFEPEREPERRPKARGRRHDKQHEQVSSIEDELKRTRENLQGTIEELETSNEELKSTNEELQSTNEELQSANEELETSREEMQSLNEELQTVNAELEERNRALSQANDDMQNLLNSIEVATVFLDDKLAIKRFTTQAKKVFSLIDSDIGRPISDLTANLRYEGLVEDAREVLRTLVFSEHEIQTKQGAWRLMRIMPYRTFENLIDGLVITFIDIDRVKIAEHEARAARSYAEAIVDAMTQALLVIDESLHVVSANRAFHELFKTRAGTVVGEPLSGLLDGTLDEPEVVERLHGLFGGNGWGTRLELHSAIPRAGTKAFMLSARAMRPDSSGSQLALLTIEEVV